jgi:hypothetical protein
MPLDAHPPPPPAFSVGVGGSHDGDAGQILSGVALAVRAGQGLWSAELGGEASFTPDAPTNLDRTLGVIAPLSNLEAGPVVGTRDRYVVQALLDVGPRGPWTPSTPRARAWGGPQLGVGVALRRLASQSITNSDGVGPTWESLPDTWSFGPALAAGVEGGYGGTVSGRLRAVVRVPVPGPTGDARDLSVPVARLSCTVELDVFFGGALAGARGGAR